MNGYQSDSSTWQMPTDHPAEVVSVGLLHGDLPVGRNTLGPAPTAGVRGPLLKGASAHTAEILCERHARQLIPAGMINASFLI